MQIKPSSELRNNYSGLMKLCREQGEPIFLTVNGRGDSVIMSIEDYNACARELRLEQFMSEADKDIVDGRTVDAEKVFANVRSRLNIKAEL